MRFNIIQAFVSWACRYSQSVTIKLSQPHKRKKAGLRGDQCDGHSRQPGSLRAEQEVPWFSVACSHRVWLVLYADGCQCSRYAFDKPTLVVGLFPGWLPLFTRRERYSPGQTCTGSRSVWQAKKQAVKFLLCGGSRNHEYHKVSCAWREHLRLTTLGCPHSSSSLMLFFASTPGPSRRRTE